MMHDISRKLYKKKQMNFVLNMIKYFRKINWHVYVGIKSQIMFYY